MSKQLFVAPAGAGKTSYALKLARETAAGLQNEVRVCVPNALQARVWRKRLAQMGGAIGVHVLTLDELVAVCLLESGKAYSELNDALQNRLLRALFDRVGLQHYAALKDKAGFVQVIKRIIAELKAGSIDPQPFAEAIREMGGEPRLQELAGIYTVYQNELIARDWADRAGLQWLATEALANDQDGAGRGWALLIVDGFEDFPPSQLALLARLAGRVENFVLTLTRAEQVAYPRYERLVRVVEEALEVKAEPLPHSGDQANKPVLDHLARRIFALSGQEPLNNDGSLALGEAVDRAAEVRMALRWLKKRIVWDGFSPGDLALLARDMIPYSPYVEEIAAEFGLPVRLLDGRALLQNPAVAALLNLLRLFLPGSSPNEVALPRRGVIEAWRSPYFSWGDGERAISGADVDALDNLSREQRVIGGLEQWRAAFAAGMAVEKPSEFDADEGFVTPLPSKVVSGLQEKFNRFLEIGYQARELRTMREFADWLKGLLGPYTEYEEKRNLLVPGSLHIFEQAQGGIESGDGGRAARNGGGTVGADLAALQRLVDLVDDLVWAEKALGRARKLDFPTLFAELVTAVGAAVFAAPPRTGQAEIIIASTAQVRGISFRAVALMGLSEGSFPQVVREDPFLRDGDRQKLREIYHLQLQPSTQSAEQAFFYEAIRRGREKLLLTRPLLAENGAEWLASPYWKAVERLVHCPVETAAGDGLVPRDEAASWAEWWEANADPAGSAAGVDELDAGIEKRIARSAAIWHARRRGEFSEWAGDLSAASAQLTESFGAGHIWSASRLEAYRNCGFLFFVQNVLQVGARPEPAEGLDATQLGSLYHDILEQAMTHGPLPLGDETAVRDFIMELAQPVLAVAPRVQGFRETPWWEQTKEEIITNAGHCVAALDDKNFEFLTAETSFGYDGPPLVLHNGDDSLSLHGYIDRIDRRQDGLLRIIDYKTSGKWAYEKRAFSEGKKLQLPLYALAAQEALGLGKVVEGFYWHIQQGEPSAFHLSKSDGGVEGALETAVYYAWETVRSIRAGQFAPIPPAEGCPNFCPAAAFCPQYSPRNY